jgi:membrane protease YdiL (CAAX protease family)
MNSERTTKITLALAETLAALGAALGLTLAGSVALSVGILLLLPQNHMRAEVPLQPVVRAELSLPHDELVERIEQFDIAREVRLDTSGYPPLLVLEGLSSSDSAQFTVLNLLAAGGYSVSGSEFSPKLDPQELLTDTRIIIPGLAIQCAVFLVIGYVMMRWRVAAPQGRPGGRRLAAIGWGVSGGLLAVLAGSALAGVLEWLGFPVHEQPILTELLADPTNLLLLAPWVVIAAPIAEEVFFRGYVFRFLSGRAGFLAGLLISSGLFAVVHLNLSGVPVYLTVGAVFALIYARSSSLLAPITAHVAYNGILLLGLAIYGVQ